MADAQQIVWLGEKRVFYGQESVPAGTLTLTGGSFTLTDYYATTTVLSGALTGVSGNGTNTLTFWLALDTAGLPAGGYVLTLTGYLNDSTNQPRVVETVITLAIRQP